MGNPDCKYILPDAIKPVCWNDNERMNALMAPIRPRNVNPTDYDSKLKFWSEIIEAWCHHYKIVSFDMPLIRACIQREGRTPACLQTVLDSLVRNGTVTYRETFLESSPQSWKGWALNLAIKKPLNWGYSKFSAILAPKDPNAIVYVLVPVIKSLGSTLLNAIYKLHLEGKLLAIDEVFRISELNSMEDLSLILHSLMQTNDVVVRYNPIASQLVKFRRKGQDGVSISEIDISVYNLKYNEKILSTHIQQLEEEKEAALNDAKKYLKSNMKQMVCQHQMEFNLKLATSVPL